MNQKLPIDYSIWENDEVAQNFLEGVRSAIPLAATQIDCLLRLIRLTQPEVRSFLDLGCGNGILGKAIRQSLALRGLPKAGAARSARRAGILWSRKARRYAIAKQYPNAQGFFIDLSPKMLEAAQENIDTSHGKYHFFLEDFGLP